MTWTFSEQVASILKASGWNAGRHVSVESIEAAVQRAFGLSPSRIVHAFMSEFSGICLKTLRDGSLVENDCFNPLQGARLIEYVFTAPSRYQDLCALSRGPLYPIGTHANMSCILMRDDGAVFSLDDLLTWFAFWGKTPEEAIEQACSPRYEIAGVGLSDDSLAVHPSELLRFEKLRDSW